MGQNGDVSTSISLVSSRGSSEPLGAELGRETFHCELSVCSMGVVGQRGKGQERGRRSHTRTCLEQAGCSSFLRVDPPGSHRRRTLNTVRGTVRDCFSGIRWWGGAVGTVFHAKHLDRALVDPGEALTIAWATVSPRSGPSCGGSDSEPISWARAGDLTLGRAIGGCRFGIGGVRSP